MSSWFGLRSSSASSKNSTIDDDSSFQEANDLNNKFDPNGIFINQSAAYRRRADEGAVFTASKCPSGPGLKNSCELPFGFIWTPMAIYNHETTTSSMDTKNDIENTERTQKIMPIIQCNDESLPPVLCLACLTYINPFVGMDYDTGKWICPLCEQENVIPKTELLNEKSQIMTALKSTCVEYRQTPQDIADDNQQVETKNSVKTKKQNNMEDYCSYILVVDDNLSPKDGQAIAPAMETILKEHFNGSPKDQYSEVRIGLIVFGKTVATYHLGLSGLASADIYAPTDPSTTLGEGDEEELQSDMDKRSYLAEVQVGRTLASLRNALASVFDIAVDDKNDSTSITTSTGFGFTSRMAMLAKRKEERSQKKQQESNGKGNSVKSISESPWVQRLKEKKSGHPIRCTGEAIQCALDLACADIPDPSRTSRIILFTNGCPNKGDGSVVAVHPAANKNKMRRRWRRPTHDIVDTIMLQKAVEYFDVTANIAVSNGIGFDVFCCGTTELALPAYQALVEPGGGYVLSLLSFEGPRLLHDLRFLLENTYMSRSRYLPEDFDDSAGAECILDIRSDTFVTPTQLCGSGELLPDLASRMIENERSAFAKGCALAAKQGIKTNKLPSTEAMDLTMTRIQIGRVDALTTFAVMLEVDDTIGEEDEFAFFQLVTRYVSRTGKEEITRVCSFKLPVAKDISEFVGSVDNEAVAVVLAKAAVYRALHGREETSETRDITAAGDTDSQEKLAYETQLDLDATIQRISGAFRLLGLEEKMKSLSIPKTPEKEPAESSLDFAFPPHLKEALQMLYHLRRGPLISPGPMKSTDDRAEIRGLFLRFPLEDCLQMMAPTIWSTGSLDGISSAWDVMQPFPAETLALWDSSIVAADFHDALFVWTGTNCAAARYDGIRENFKAYLLERAKNRFPMPEYYELKDGDSMCRRFTSRLAPSHADPVDNQIVHFPALSTLDSAALEKVRSKFKFYDSNSDASFRTWFWSVASASNVSRLEGRSLCE